jgi:hypothetical protein
MLKQTQCSSTFTKCVKLDLSRIGQTAQTAHEVTAYYEVLNWPTSNNNNNTARLLAQTQIRRQCVVNAFAKGEESR